jgi:hypothetical protein
MKKNLFIIMCICLLLSNNILLGQKGVTLAINSSHPGNSIFIGFAKRYESHTFQIGLKYHINKKSLDSPVSNLYKGNYFSSSFIDHFGTFFSYDYSIITHVKSFSPFVYYDLHLIHSSLIRPGITGEIHSNDLFDEVWTFDNYCGVGIKYLFSDRIIIFSKGGLGVSTCVTPPYELFRNDFETEFALQVNVGLTLFFNSKINK